MKVRRWNGPAGGGWRGALSGRPCRVGPGASGAALMLLVTFGIVACAGPQTDRASALAQPAVTPPGGGAGAHPGAASTQAPSSQPPPVQSPPAQAPPAQPPPAQPPPAQLPSAQSDQAVGGCDGLITAAQVATATGLRVTGTGEAAARQYFTVVWEQGHAGSARVCSFATTAGDQVHVIGMSFADAGQAQRMFDSGPAGPPVGRTQPVPGVGDAAITDRSHTLLARRGPHLVLVYLARVDEPDRDHVAALRAVALDALARL